MRCQALSPVRPLPVRRLGVELELGSTWFLLLSSEGGVRCALLSLRDGSVRPALLSSGGISRTGGAGIRGVVAARLPGATLKRH